jgi:cytochrome c2
MLIAAMLLLPLAGCGKAGADLHPTASTPGGAIGSVDRGHDLIERIGCGSCHTIPGIVDAVGLVGPPLDNIGRRGYLAGLLHNTPENMVRWLRHPQQIVPGNAMPDMGLSEEDARDIAAYLYTLK